MGTAHGVPRARWRSAEPLYLIRYCRHAALVPRLDAALQRMTREGVVEKYFEAGVRALKLRALIAEDAVAKEPPRRR